jgi:hypothetical protein
MGVVIDIDAAAERHVPIWVKDEQWEVWHAWPAEERMTASGETRTACGSYWHWSDRIETSYHVLSLVACYLCTLALEGTPVKKRGRPALLPAGPRPPKKPRGRPARPLVEPEPLEGMQHIRRERRESRARLERIEASSRTERLLALGAKAITYTRPDGTVVTSAHPDKGTQAKLTAEEAAVDWSGTFEVGRRLECWPCMQCGAVLAAGNRFCSRWCEREQVLDEQPRAWERTGRAMARRQFEDMLYGRERRDAIRSWSPPSRSLRWLDRDAYLADLSQR